MIWRLWRGRAKLSTCQNFPPKSTNYWGVSWAGRHSAHGGGAPSQVQPQPNTCSSSSCSSPDPESQKWTNYNIPNLFWLELISFINSNQTTGWLAGDGTAILLSLGPKHGGSLESTTMAQIMFYYYQHQNIQTEPNWLPWNRTLKKYVQRQC